MLLYEKVILKNDPDFKNLTTSEKKDYLKILKHKHLALWLSSKFAKTADPLLFSLFLCTITLLCSISTPVLACAFYIITLPLVLFTVVLECIVIFKLLCLKHAPNRIRLWLFDFFMSFWLLNGKVISHKDWKFIKEKDKGFYAYLRSDECNHRCYATTHEIATFLKKRDIRIVWVAVRTPTEEVGHAILERRGYIYDSNNRKTYPKEVYYKSFNVEQYRRFYLREYSSENFFKDHFDNFVEWCKNRGVIPFDDN